MTSFFSMTRALVARKRKIFALFFALAASIGLSWAQNPSGTCGDNLTWELDETTGALTISGTGTMLYDPSWMNEGLNARITSVSLPEGLTYIRDYVFADCEKLESITLPSGLTYIGSSAFMNCRALREITLPGSLTTLGERAFNNCWQLESIKLPEGITTLGNEVFAHCNHLQSVTLPPTLTTLGEGVFRECSRLEAITLPDGLTSIGNNAFSGCHYLGSITIPEGVTSIGNNAFEYCGFESIKLPEGITTLGNGVFSNCNSLRSVTLPPNLTSIGEWAFNGCGNLASVTLPESVTSIGANAFSYCGVTSMTLPAGVTTIGEEAFAYCYGLTEFTNKAATPQTINANVFSEVTLSNITLNVPGTSKAAYEAADVWKDFGTKATIPAVITKTITDNGMTYDIYDNGVVKVSGTGIVAARIFASNDHDYVTSVKRFEFADDCKVYSFGEDWYMCYMSYSPLEAADIKTTLPFVAGRNSVFYKKEYDSESVTVTITAPVIASITKEFVANYGTPQHIIFNMPVTTFEKNWCSYLSEKDTVTIPTGSLYHLPASYVFKDEGTQFSYDYQAADGMEDMFWQYEGSSLVEGVDYTRTEEETGVITAENETKVFGKAVVKYQAPQEAPATSWTFWRLDDLRTFPELESGSSHTCKDVTLKIVDGSFINVSGIFIRLSTSATNGIQLIAPKGKIFKQVIALDRDLRTSLIWTGEADTVGISSFMEISLIEFELDAAPALPEAVTGLVYTGEAQTLVAAGEAEGYTFQYKLGENGEYSADLPKATDAGSYTVYYKATAEGKEDITGSVDATIAKADINLGGSEGALMGKFSVADGKAIYFSQGNLQYNSNTQAWQFAGNQYHFVGDAAGNTSVIDDGIADNNGTVDLFGWVGASSTWTGLKQYGITALDDAAMNVTDGCGNNASEALKSDWGTTMGEGWFTLSTEQWTYLFNTRTGDKAATVNSVADCRYTKATINTDGTAVRGIILFPDGGTFAASEFTEVGSPNTANANYTTACTTAQWTALQTKGCVFLPAAGNRVGTSVTAAGWAGYYWSSSPDPFDMSSAYCAYFGPDNVDPAINDFRFYGYSVRLVTEAAPASVTLPKAVAGLTANGEAQTLITAGECEDGTLYYSLDKENWSTDLPTGTGAQDYTVYYYVKGDANHNDSEVNSLTASIGTLPQALLGLVYTGEAQTLVTAGEAAGFTYQYKVGENGEYSTDLPTAINAGSYTVYYKATAAGEQDITGSVEVFIAKADINLGGGSSTLKGAFSIADGKAVYFSKGNLQATTADLGANWTWAFAEHQYDFVGNAAANTSITEDGIAENNGTLDLFGWSTATSKYGIHNNATTSDNAGDFVDWGTTMGEGWFTLSTEQWQYLFNTRTGDKAATVNSVADCRYTKATINTDGTAVTGIILFPDGGTFAASEFTEVGSPNTGNVNYTTTCTTAQWNALQAKGCVFLPAAGFSYGKSVSSVGSGGYYWSSSAREVVGSVYNVSFYSSFVNPADYSSRYSGYSVRLVTETAPAEDTPTTTTTVTWNSSTISSINNIRNGESFTEGDVTVTVLNGQIDGTSKWKGNSVDASFKFSTSLGNFTRIEITGEIRGLGGSGWTQTDPGAVWTGDANEITFGMYFKNVTQIVFTIEEHAPAPSVTLPQAIDTLVYTGEKQALISAGECADGTFLYKVGENGTWVDTLPKVTDAGTYQVYYKIQGDANHNDYIAAEPLEVSIAKAALTITAENKEVVYGYAAPGFSVSYSGLQGSDLPVDVLTGKLSYACDYTVGSNVASYDITPSGQTSANYDITYVKGTLVVYKADPAFTAPTANTLTYNGGAQTLIAAGTTEHGTFEYTFTPNDDESWNTALPQAKNADTYGVYYRVVGDANHLDYESADAVVVTIAKAALTATADDKSVIYGDAVPTYTVTYEGWQGEDDETVLTGTIAYACEYAPTSNVGDYTIVPSGISSPNYAITFVNGKVTVSKAALTITADNKEVTYGDEAPAFTASYEGWKNEDNETVVSGLTLTSEYVLTSNVGEYDIVPADATAQNYAISYTNGTLTVNQAPLMITADDKEVIYGDEHPAFTASYEGWKNADDESVVSGLTLTSEYVLTSNVGEYDIVPADATAQNYAISYTNGTLTVNKAPLMITADDKEVIYGDEAPAFTASYEGWKNADNESVVSGLTLTSEYVLTSNVGEYDIVPANAEAQNYAISYTNGTLTVNQAPLTITAEDKMMFYGNEAPEFTVTYAGWKNEDNEAVVSGLKYTCEYRPGSYIGAYSIEPNSATAQNYAITFVDGTLTVNRAAVIVSGAKVQIAKFEDGTTDAVILDKGILNGVMLNDPVDHITTASFSDATVGEHKTIRVNYELTGDAALLANYDLILTAENYIEEGVIIENFVPAEEGETEKEDDEAQIEEGIEVYAYGYCDGSGYSLRYHLNSGNPDQYKIDFDDSRFTDVDWTNLETPGKDGTIDIEIPVDLPTGDYTFTATFRDSRFTWLPSNPMTVTFHVNLPETYVVALFDNVMAVVDTCECLTDIQWYWRANSTDQWQAIEGATGYYYKQEGGLSGEYFIKAKMNGVDTYTCSQDDMSLYGADKQAKVSAYPNPVVNTTTVTIENSRLYEHKLRIVNLMGIEMMTTSFEGNTTSVEMGTFPQGHYMISVDGVVVKVMKK